jgi:hypothetical protein
MEEARICGGTNGGKRLPFGGATKNIKIKIRRGLKRLQNVLKRLQNVLKRNNQAREADTDERRWWAADDVTRVADDDGRRTMMSGNERS